MFLRDACARVGDDELLRVCAALLEVQPDFAIGRCVLGSIAQEVQQDARHVLLVDSYRQLGGVHVQRNIVPHFASHLVHHAFAEGEDVGFLHLVGLGQRVFQGGEFLNVVREGQQGLYARLLGVQRVQRGFHLGGYVADELCLQGIVLIDRLDDLLLFARLHDEAQQYNGAQH